MPAVDEDAFAELIVKFSRIFARFPDIEEIDLNPVIARGKDLWCVDARIITDGTLS
jgi:hypothetical protein